jgi:hypothetical protein
MGTRPLRSTKQPHRPAAKQPPEEREPKKPKKQLEEVCKEMRNTLWEERRKREAKEEEARQRVLEDAVMEQIYGPTWRSTG